MDPSLVNFGIQAIIGLGQGSREERSASSFNASAETNAYASNLVRSANNELGSARGQLARYTQSVNNGRTLKQSGAQAEAAQINYRRSRDSMTLDNFEQQIQFAEQAGRAAAQQAFSGVSGNVADLVNGATALRKARIQQRTDEASKQMAWDAGRKNAQILAAGWDSLDNSVIMDNLDYQQDVASTQQRRGNWFTDVVGRQNLKDLSNVFSFNIGQFDAFKDQAGTPGSGYGGEGRTITGGR